MKNFLKKLNLKAIIGIYLIVNILVVIWLFFYFSPSFFCSFYMTMKDDDIIISAVNPTIQALGLYDSCYTKNVNGKEFKIGVKIERANKIIVSCLLVFFIPNLIVICLFFYFIFYALKIKPVYHKKKKIQIGVFFIMVSYILLNIIIFSWIISYFSIEKNTEKFMPIKEKDSILSSEYVSTKDAGWYNLQLPISADGNDYYLSINLSGISKIFFMFLRIFFIPNYIFSTMLFLLFYYLKASKKIKYL